MAKVPHCKYCTKPILDKTQAIKKGNYWYHLDCYEKLNAEKEANKSDYEKLISYLNELYNGNIPVFIFKQIKDYKNDYGMKYSGILLTLHYMYDILDMKFDESNGIGMVVYKYDEAKNNWMKEQKIKKAVTNFEFEDKEVVINKKPTKNKYKYKEINLEEL